MIFGLLTIKGDRHIATIFGKSVGGRRNQRNPLIRRTEQLVERKSGVQDRARVESPETPQRVSVIEQSSIEKIRRQATRFGGE